MNEYVFVGGVFVVSLLYFGWHKLNNTPDGWWLDVLAPDKPNRPEYERENNQS